MATRKKKIEELVNVSSSEWPKINQGSHLTVKTFEDGRTELIWNDEALLRDVQMAILSIESRIPVEIKQGEENGKTKKTRKSK